MNVSVTRAMCECVSPRLCYVSGVGAGVRGRVARQGLAALSLHGVQGSWCAGEWASRENQLWDLHTFPHVCTHSLQGTLGLPEERQEGCPELLFPPCSPPSFPSPQEGLGQAAEKGNRS